MSIFEKQLRGFDWLFFFAIIILSAIGVMMIYSTGLGSRGADSGLWVRQLAFVGVGLAGFFFLSTLDYRFFRKNSSWLYLFSILLLVAVLFFGEDIRGSRRWFELGVMNFQPAEFSKFTLIFILARFLQVNRPMFNKFRYVIWLFVYALIPFVLIMIQPDLGSAVVHVAIWAGMVLASSMPKKFLVYLFVIFAAGSVLSWNFVLEDYQKDRVHTFIEPTTDPLGRGYNVIQSMVAIGSGGLTGQGLARGLQSQLRFLPERQTDFIFASTVEELGLLGGIVILLLFAFLSFRMLRTVALAQDSFGMYIATGILFLFLSQIVVNIGMNLGLLPVTGITLPFMSYGGSSLVINFWLMGVMVSIMRNSIPVRFG